jgi:glycosyltransferase involved in cell wall biosynthesis
MTTLPSDCAKHDGTQPFVSLVIATGQASGNSLPGLQSLPSEASLVENSEIVVVTTTGGWSGNDEPRKWGRRFNILQTAIDVSVPLAYNLGAAHTKGKYLVLLDGRAFAEARWLDWLVQTAEANPTAGAVGSVLLFPEGRLQEAGAIIWSDGSRTGVGEGMDGSQHQWHFVRSVDCTSARALLIRREAWDRAGGFDHTFARLGFGDVDLCLRIRALGLDVLLEPRSRVRVEQEDARTEYDAFLRERGRQEIARRWKHELLTHEPPSSRSIVRAVHRARGYPRRLLVVDDFLPDPAAGAGFGRMLDAMIELARHGWAVSHFPTRGRAPASDALVDHGVAIVEGDLGHHLADPDTWYDVILVSRPHNLDGLSTLVHAHQPWSRLIYDAEALWWRRMERQAQFTINPEAAAQLHVETAAMRALESRNARSAELVITVSDEERALFLDEGIEPARVHTLPPYWLESRFSQRPFAERQDVGFVAGWMAGLNSPNGDGLLWFIREVLPVLRRDLPWVRVRVTGRDPPGELLSLADPNLCFEGHVADLDTFYDRIRVIIVPNRFGSGVKLKIVQAIQYAVPVVSTAVGAEGLNLGSPTGLRIADAPQAFAAEVHRLLTDEKEWSRQRFALMAQAQAWTAARLAAGSWPELLAGLLAKEKP